MFFSVLHLLSIVLTTTLCGSNEESNSNSTAPSSQTNMSHIFSDNTNENTTSQIVDQSTVIENDTRIWNISEVTDYNHTAEPRILEMETFNFSLPINESDVPPFPIEMEYNYFDYGENLVDIHQQSLQVDTCGEYCDNSSKFYLPTLCGFFVCPYCSCDEKCREYGDCCPDINGTVPSKQPLDEEYVCVSHWHNFAVHDNFYMIKSCASNMTSEMDIADVLEPVTSTLTNKTYYNEFYARCHNEEQLTVWNNVTHCNYYYYYNYDDDKEQEPEVCESLFDPPLGVHDLRTCSTHHSIPPEFLISRCNNSGSETDQDPVLERLCESSDYRVEFHGAYYRNIFCALCNGETPPSNCFLKAPELYEDHVVTINDLFNFASSPNEEEEARNCTDADWVEPDTMTCFPILCLQGRYFKNGECRLDNHTVEKTEYVFEIDFHVRKRFQLFNWTDVVQMFEKNVSLVLSKFDPLVYMFTVDNLYESYQTFPSDNEAVESLNNTVALGISVSMRSVSKADVQEYEDHILSVIWSDWVFRLYGEDIILTPRTVHRDFVSRDHAMFFNDPLTKTCCSNIHYFEWINIISNERTDFPMFAENYISLTADLECPHVRFIRGEYEIYPNHTLRLVNSNITLAKDKYRHTSFDVQVCVSDLNGGDPSISIMRKVEMYLSIICTCISLVCILLTLVTFLNFPVLQTLPTKNTMFLAASIFVAQATFQFGGNKTENKSLCQVIGVLNHFLWLCVTFWMNVCCYHMFHVFVSSSKTISGHGSHWKTLFKYMTYVYGMSAAIVAATLAANYVSSDGSSIGYGSHICYIDKAMVVGLAFILPLGLVIISNTIFFSCTVYTIYRIRKIEASSSSDQRNVFVYIKLSTLTGTFWILSIVAKASGSDVLSIISVVLNGSQGFFIFVSYILNKRVYKLWRKSSSKKEPLVSRSSTYINSTTF